MELLLKRIAKKSTYTIGRLYIDGQYVCDTIEDKDRGLTSSMSLNEIKKIKVASLTAIPSGTYVVTLNVQSPKFSKKQYYMDYCKGYLPRLLNVPGFDGVLMHKGNTEKDSAGCIILGYNKQVGKVLNSKLAFEKVYTILKSTEEDIRITIE